MAHTNKLAIELVQGSTSRLPLLNNHSLGKSLNQPLSFPFIEIQLFVLRFLNVIRLSKRLYQDRNCVIFYWNLSDVTPNELFLENLLHKVSQNSFYSINLCAFHESEIHFLPQAQVLGFSSRAEEYHSILAMSRLKPSSKVYAKNGSLCEMLTWIGIKPHDSIKLLKWPSRFIGVVMIVTFLSFVLAANVPIPPPMSSPIRIVPRGFVPRTWSIPKSRPPLPKSHLVW